MGNVSKAVVGALTAATLATTSIPAGAQPQKHDREHHDRVDAGEVIAGAIIIGGLVALASSANRRDRDGYWGSPRVAVERCVEAAEQRASRRSWRGNADVTDIRSVREVRRGYEVRGRIAVNTRGRDWRGDDGYYGRGWDGDYRGWREELRGYDSGTFTCRYQRGRVTSVDFRGIPGL